MKLSLQSRLLLLGFAPLVVLNLVVQLICLRDFQDANGRVVQLLAERSADSLAASLQQPVWDLSTSQVEQLADSALSLTETSAVLVIGAENGSVLFGKQKGRDNQIQPATLSDATHLSIGSAVKISRDIRYNNQTLAYLTIWFDWQKLETISMEKGVSQAQKKLSIMTLIQLVASVLLGWMLSRNITASLATLSRSIANISNILQKFGEASLHNSQNLRASSDEQIAILKKVAENIERAKNGIASSADEVKNAHRHSVVVSEMTSRNLASMEMMEASLSSVAEANQRIQEMDRILNNVAAKTEVIHEIVFKTQMLSFNAAIEASHAGHHGKGFAVVAEEVGNLARLSGSTAVETSEILEKSRQDVADVAREIQLRTEAGVNGGRNILTELQTVVGHHSDLRNKLENSATMAAKQHQDIQETTALVEKLGTAVQETNNAALKDQAIAAELEHESRKLHEISETLLVAVLGTNKLRGKRQVKHR